MDEKQYPRHWWFSCNTFTLYLQSDEEDNVVTTNDALTNWVGKPLKELTLWIKHNHGGLLCREYDEGGNIIG